MQKRDFLKKLLIASGMASFPALNHPLLAQSSFNGKLVMALQLQGGVDVTAFCDPKENQSGEPEINWWARNDVTRSAGNIDYAPFADNQAFFENHFQNMLVINGVDAQTNSHSVGVVNNWSGRNSEGYPSLTALYAAINAPDLPMSYLNFGGYGNTASLIRSTRVDDVSQIQNIIFPNEDRYDSAASFRTDSDWQRIQNYQAQSIDLLNQESGLPAANRNNREFYLQALERAEGIKVFGNMIPDEDSIQEVRELEQNHYSSLHQQIQVSLLAFSSGVAICSGLYQDGFDSNESNDADQSVLLSTTTDAIDYLWSTAEELGLADRIVLVIGSDFGRTPHYNSGEGKDHWPIGSYIVMERNASYTNQAFGETDGGHNAFSINTESGQRDDVNGVTIKPAHVHLALRNYLGINNSSQASQFPFNNTEDFNFFGS
ncbi:MAG: DUF1501 domain-containing protein [Pseudomonadales bacterium]|nr:DUF1501 domain-containing protein [Pseudomonadales bacterium]